MKNTFKKFAGIAAASIMAASMVAPMAMNTSAADITITGISTEVAHTFEVYQIFTGELSNGKLSNLKWGTGVASYAGTEADLGELVPESVITAITALPDASGLVNANGLVLSTTFTEMTSTAGTATLTGLDNGYYVVKDVTNLDGKDDANSAWIVQVAGTASLAIKNATPTVDKQVWDEDTDDDKEEDANWGETADHAINEPFQFKLVANVPANPNNAYYETYKVVFKDTYSAGVTYDGIASVKVGDTVLADGEYTVTSDTEKRSLDITINDIKVYDTNLVDGATVEVIYNAHLNASAAVNEFEGTSSTTNENNVYLEYSNNPDGTGTGEAGQDKTDLGKTEDDSVWVFTYKVKNTKYENTAEAGNELDGAGFQLLNGTTPIKFIDNGDGTYTVADQTAALTPEDDTEATVKIVDTITSANGGKFDIIGLDTGTYTLKETVTPEGFNTCGDTTIVITAEHLENTGGVATTDLTNSANMNNDIINKSGSQLPSTGGVGTTLFYLGGGAMVAVAGVYLISKKRMKNED